MPFSILDLIFPKRCVNCTKIGGYLCRECFSKIEYIDKPVCPVCQRQAVGGKTHPGCQRPLGLDGLVVATRYRGPIKRAIAQLKYRWSWDIGKTLVDLLVPSLWLYDLPKDLILVPVPLHSKRARRRGFNQAAILTDLLAKRFAVVKVALLERVVDTRSQVGLAKDDRRKNIKGAFAIRGSTPKANTKSSGVEPLNLKGKNFLVVDDVFTSGATMAECAKVLKRAGAASVWAMAVALG